MFYVNAYERTERYGGPEEGGWWYSVFEFVQCELATPNPAAADSWCRRMRQLNAECGGRPVWHVPNVPDDDDGDYDNLVSVSYMNLTYSVEFEPGEDWNTYPEGGWA
jgi:hypothetical protein